MHWTIAVVDGHAFDDGFAAFQEAWNLSRPTAGYQGPRRRRLPARPSVLDPVGGGVDAATYLVRCPRRDVAVKLKSDGLEAE